MNFQKIKRVEIEATRLLAVIEDLWSMHRAGLIRDRSIIVGNGTKETATLRRASMDLTRALAEMRKPG